jgi:hypothetical protein
VGLFWVFKGTQTEVCATGGVAGCEVLCEGGWAVLRFIKAHRLKSVLLAERGAMRGGERLCKGGRGW